MQRSPLFLALLLGALVVGAFTVPGRFPNPAAGVRAQIQLLRSYADPDSRASDLASPPEPTLFGATPEALRLENPIASDLDQMRPTPVASLLLVLPADHQTAGWVGLHDLAVVEDHTIAGYQRPRSARRPFAFTAHAEPVLLHGFSIGQGMPQLLGCRADIGHVGKERSTAAWAFSRCCFSIERATRHENQSGALRRPRYEFQFNGCEIQYDGNHRTAAPELA